MVTRDARVRLRIPYVGPIRITWEDTQGNVKYVTGRCIDVSEGGLRVEVPETIPVRTRVGLLAVRIKLSGSASVRHVTRHGIKYILGLEWGADLRDRARSLVREPWELRTTQ